MRATNGWARLTAGALAIALIAVACSDDDSDRDTSAAEPTATSDATDNDTMDHHHGAQEWEGDAPTVTLAVEPDAVGGWNVFADVSEDFTFAPEHASSEHVPGEGHAHVYVDGEKLARVYGESHHIAELPPGTHEVTYTLTTNAHDAYVVDGEPLAVSVTVEVPDADRQDDVARRDDAPADVAIEASYANGAVTTAEPRYDVDAGQMVRIEVASDVPEEVHVHGYDLLAEVGPDQPAAIAFDATIPGVFEVELEGTGTLLFELAVS